MGDAPARRPVAADDHRRRGGTLKLRLSLLITALAERAIQLGARGYVTKSSAPEVLAAAVAEVAAGLLSLSPDVAKSIAVLKLSGDQSPLRVLTAREFEVFRLIVGGRATADIARLLNLSGKTIANYHTLIKQKLGLASDVELVLLAQRQNLIV